METRKALQPAKMRRVYVNGIECRSMAMGARLASSIAGRLVSLWEIQRQLSNRKYGRKIPGVEVSESPPKPPAPQNPPAPPGRKPGPLLRYPPGESPLERGTCRAQP